MAAIPNAAPIKDVFDFYSRWPELRPQVLTLIETGECAAGDQEILSWLVKIMDRVGPPDVEGSGTP